MASFRQSTSTQAAADHPAKSARRLVVKVGSSLVTNAAQGIDAEALLPWARQIKQLREQGREVIWVSSGAIAEGMVRLGWRERPRQIDELQAAAAVGQMGLIECYQRILSSQGLQCAQILLTHEDLADRKRYLNARSTLLTLLRLGVLPIINENDSVVTDEIKFGDNDTLSALVANLCEADLLVILTDQEGFFSADPRRDASATLIPRADAFDPQWLEAASGPGSAIGRGGMQTKLLAARRATRSGAATVITHGRSPDVLLRLTAGEWLGTLFETQTRPLSARQQWLMDHLQTQGWVVVDDGARNKLLAPRGASLLPVGVREAHGEFARGDVISVRDQTGVEIARGISNYAAAEVRLIAGKPSRDIAAILGYVEASELMHRDNLVRTLPLESGTNP